MPTPSSEDGILAVQTGTLIGARTGIKRTGAGGGQCLSWVIFGSRFWRLQSPLFLHERTSLVAMCSPKLAERPRPPKLAERRRTAEGGSDTHRVLDDRDGFRGKLNPSCDLLPDGLFNLPDGQIS